MKRINNNGVVLLETLIVCIFIMSISVFVYKNLIPLMGRYEKLESFDDVDSVYAANLVKNLVISNISLDYIGDNLLASSNYADISNCNDPTLYSDSNYCKKIKENLHIEDDDFIFITRYDAGSLKKFRKDVDDSKFSRYNTKEHSKFKDYLKTVSNSEKFYQEQAGTSSLKVNALYRVFISRTVYMMDGTSVKKYANIGIYKAIN